MTSKEPGDKMNYNIKLARDLINIPKTDLLAAIALVHGEKSMVEIQDFLRQDVLLSKSNFAVALINWDDDTDPMLMRQSAMECLKDQYPELYEQLRSDYGSDV
jgi:hypothetical protein